MWQAAANIVNGHCRDPILNAHAPHYPLWAAGVLLKNLSNVELFQTLPARLLLLAIRCSISSFWNCSLVDCLPRSE
jgi:hypothetical protein